MENYVVKQQSNAVAVHILAIIGLYYYWDPLYLLVFFLGHRLIMGLGDDIGMHRYFTHKSFKTTKFYEFMFLFFSWFTIQGSTVTWVLRHRYHHAYSDKENDPHISTHWAKTWFWVLDRSRDYSLSPVMVRDLMRSKMHMFMHNYYYLGYWTMIMCFALLFGVKFTLYFFILNGVIGFHTAGVINVLCHKFGYRTFDLDDNSTNLTWVNYIHMGAGLHHNHHAYPSSYTNKYKDNEFDPSAWLIKNVFATNVDELKDIRTHKKV